MLRTQVSRASMPGTGPRAGTAGREVDVRGMPVLDMHVQDHPCMARPGLPQDRKNGGIAKARSGRKREGTTVVGQFLSNLTSDSRSPLFRMTSM